MGELAEWYSNLTRGQVWRFRIGAVLAVVLLIVGFTEGRPVFYAVPLMICAVQWVLIGRRGRAAVLGRANDA